MAQTGGVNGLGSVLGNLNVGATSTTNGNKGTSKVAAGAPGVDQASLSVAGGFAAQGDGDVRTAKIAALQQAIAAGTYNISAGDVAGRIIDALMA